MLVALDADGGRVEAGRNLAMASWRCPLCAGETILKKGPRKIAHFAHVARLDCPLSGEGEEHLRVKFGLVRQLRAKGWRCDPEVALDPTRIVDVLATRPEDGRRLAVEVQASAISIAEVDRRIDLDRSYGIETGWLFTERRLGSRWREFDQAWREGRSPAVLRLPTEIVHLHRRYRVGVFVALSLSGADHDDRPEVPIVRVDLAAAWAPVVDSPIWYPPRRLSSTFTVTALTRLTEATLATAAGSRWQDRTVVFTGTAKPVAPGSVSG